MWLLFLMLQYFLSFVQKQFFLFAKHSFYFWFLPNASCLLAPDQFSVWFLLTTYRSLLPLCNSIILFRNRGMRPYIIARKYSEPLVKRQWVIHEQLRTYACQLRIY